MPFIGKQPQVGAYSKLDAITASATATYNLALNSGAYYPSSANHLMVSLNGVIQAPQDSFTISGRTIIFDSALTSNDSIDFIMALGDVLDIGTPSDGTVVTAKIQNAAVTTAKLASSLDLSGKTVTMPTGAVIQVVQTTFGQQSTTTTSTSFAATGHSVSITPSSTSSKILLYVIGGGHYLPSGNTMATQTIFRNSTNIGDSNTGLQNAYTVGTTGFTITAHSMMVLDSPSTTSAITYQTYMKTAGGTYQYQGSDRGDINFIAMEIAG